MQKNIIFILITSVIFATLILFKPIFTVIGLLLLISMVLFFKNEKMIFYFLLFLVPIDRFYLPFFYRLKAYQVVLIIVLLLSIAAILSNRKKIYLHWESVDIAILLIYLAMALSFFVSIDHTTYLKSLMLNTFFVGLYFYIRLCLNSIPAQGMLKFMIYTSIVFIVFGFIEFILGKFHIVPLDISEEIYIYGGRPWGVFKEPDWFGGYLSFIVSLTLPFMNNRIYKRERFILYLAIIMSLLIVVRSSWLGMLVGIFLALLLSKDARRVLAPSLIKLSIIILVFLILVLPFSYLHFKSICDRFISIFENLVYKQYDSAAQVRLNTAAIVQDYITRRPLGGYGAGAWEFLSTRHKDINPCLSANNILLTPIFEMGIIGGLLYLFLYISLWKIIRNGLKYALTDIEKRYAIGIAIAVIGTFVVAIFNDITLTGFYWAFIAIFVNYIISLREKYENRI